MNRCVFVVKKAHIILPQCGQVFSGAIYQWFQVQPYSVKINNLSCLFLSATRTSPLERRVTPYPGPVRVLAHPEGPAWAIGRIALSDTPAGAHTLKATLPVGLDRG
jgi:hypothetical protein